MNYRVRFPLPACPAFSERLAAQSDRWRLGLVAIAVGVLAAGCASIDSRVEGLLSERNYVDARALLEEAGAGAQVVQDLNEQSIAARTALSRAVWSDFGDRAIDERDAGRPRAAQVLIDEGLGHCPWAEELGELGKENRALIRSIDAIVEEWEGQELAGVASARELLVRLDPVASKLVDSPRLDELRMSAWMRVVDHWASLIREESDLPSEATAIALERELSAHPSEGSYVQQLVEWMGAAQELATQTGVPSSGPADLFDLMTDLSEASQERVASDSRSGRQLGVVSAELHRSLRRWLESSVPSILGREEIDLDDLVSAELLYQGHEGSSRIRESLCLAHVARARELGRGGPTALLAWAHLHRAEALGTAPQEQELATVRRLVEAALGSTDWPEFAIGVEIGPGVDPPLQRLVYWAIRRHFEGRSQGWTEWRWVDPNAADRSVLFEVEGASFVSPSFEDLEQRSSRYFSHFQDVPNPRKSALRSQLAVQEISVSTAESSYDWAVTSFNINPTQFGLNQINIARSGYNMAVDQYNILVGLFNATPATVTEEVYLPYSFQEGEVEFGWQLDVSIEVAGRREGHRSSSMESDFVRIGTRPEDQSKRYRRDDPVDIDTSPEAGIAHLSKALSGVEEQLNVAIARVPRSWLVDVSAEEESLLGWLLHPMGTKTIGQATGEVPDFVLTAMDELGLRPPVRAPQPIAIRSPSEMPPEGASAEEIASWYEPIVCEIRVENSGSLLSHGSGVVISDDGLILTCAHVLGGPQLKARIHAGEWAGDYDLELLFADERSDAAILRAHGLETTRWAPVRLEEPTTRGEPLVAIGNPVLQGGGTSYLAVTEGIVSDPLANRFDSEFLVADVNIRSGSSGGPLIAKRDGQVIGVVQAVATAGIPTEAEPGVASSGFTCLAAPSQALEERLGLTSD